uniref:Uncharacterized protein n=1 Tax=Daphnia galeata TaxID=27404 RepID=A0A8J2S1N5_9CRUS|nr:unnamed protein product [Daphnia galeata]
MKFLFSLVLVIACLNLNLLAHPQQPGNRLADLSEALESSISQTDDMPPEMESPEFPYLLYKCCHQEDFTLALSCERETELKLNTTKPIPIKKDASQEDFKKKRDKFDLVDELTNQFNMDEYIEGYKTTSLSMEQKTLVSTEFKSCVTANFTTPSLPLFIQWTDSRTKANEATGNWVAVMHVVRCDLLALIKNGCSDPSVSKSTLTWIIKDILTDIAKDLH